MKKPMINHNVSKRKDSPRTGRSGGWRQLHRAVEILPPQPNVPIHWRIGPLEIKIFTYWPVPYFWKPRVSRYRGGTGWFCTLIQFGCVSLNWAAPPKTR